jgi:hypothetical protein
MLYPAYPPTPPDRGSDEPATLDVLDEPSGSSRLGITHLKRKSQVPGYAVLGVLVGVLALVTVALARQTVRKDNAVVEDNVVRVNEEELPPSCMQDARVKRNVHFTVTADVEVDGRVQNVRASASDPTAPPRLRECVSAWVGRWAFLPQARASHLEVPLEIRRR